MKYFWTRYMPGYITAVVYMLQVTEYKPTAYIAWLRRQADFRTVMHRQTLDKTSKAKALLLLLRTTAVLCIVTIGVLLIIAFNQQSSAWFISAVLIAILYPFIIAYGVIAVLWVGYMLIQKPREKAIIQKADAILANHPAKHRIAIVGSYGKTTAKEVLKTVLGESLHIAATPGNMNTDIGISHFASQLNGGEEVLIFEFGEEYEGDVARLARLTRPSIAILTGASSAHLESFKSVDAVVKTLREIEDYVPKEKIYVNGTSVLLNDVGDETMRFSESGIGAYKVYGIKADLHGTSFELSCGAEKLSINTKLIGEHLIGVCSAVAVLASELGMKDKSIEAGFSKVKPFEYRMQPYLLHGATIIDDTYNGNSEGMKAGLMLLKNTKTKKRRVYVTPGLVEQGTLTEQVHVELGRQIAKSADVAVLMNNSVTKYIVQGLDEAGFNGQLLQVDDPLSFYNNLDQFVIEGDVVLMQNDWTDNYA